MKRARVVVVAGLFLATILPSGHYIAEAAETLACSTLDGKALDACIAKQAQLERNRLAPVMKAAANASGHACSALPGPAIGACLEQAKDAADKALNVEYKKAMASIDSEAASSSEATAWKRELKAAQESWMKFRDADCGELIDYEWHRGTGMGAAIEQCLLDKTSMRVEELRSRYSAR